MEFKNHLSNKLWSLFLILCITRVCHGHLMCYVCENCSEVNAQTPQFECNEDFFNAGGTTDSSIQTTTTELPRTTSDVIESSSSTTTTSTEMPTTTNEPSTTTTEETTMETTTEITTEETTSTIMDTTTEKDIEVTGSTTNTTAKPEPPTPGTVGPPSTTTSAPTPPNIGTQKSIDDVEKLNNATKQVLTYAEQADVEVDGIEVEHISTTKAYQPSAAFRIRQLRAVSDVTYHCFKIQAMNAVNNSMTTNRGCSRVATMESVCGQWQAQHSMEKVNKCYPCSNTKCNGSAALNVSITAMIMAVVALFLHRK